MTCTWSNQTLVLFALLLEGLVVRMAYAMTEISLEMHIPGRILCNHKFPDGSFYSARWTKSSSDESYVNGFQALVRWDWGNRTVIDPKYDIDTDLSLLINSVSLEDAGIYRCTVYPEGNIRNSERDNKLSVYKQPKYPPVMIYMIQDGNIEINCSVGPIFPLNYPKFHLPPQNNNPVLNQRDINQDGTYMAMISTSYSYDGSGFIWKCSYSSHNDAWTSSLSKFHIPTIKGDATTTIIPNNGNDKQNKAESQKHLLTFFVILFILFGISVALHIYIYLKYIRRKQLKVRKDAEKNGNIANGSNLL